jgi:hypothetical protein
LRKKHPALGQRVVGDLDRALGRLQGRIMLDRLPDEIVERRRLRPTSGPRRRRRSQSADGQREVRPSRRRAPPVFPANSHRQRAPAPAKNSARPSPTWPTQGAQHARRRRHVAVEVRGLASDPIHSKRRLSGKPDLHPRSVRHRAHPRYRMFPQFPLPGRSGAGPAQRRAAAVVR